MTHTPKYVNQGVPFVSVKDLKYKHIEFDDVKYITREEFDSLPGACKPQKNDIVFGRVGTLGNPCIVSKDKEFAIFVSLGFLRAKKDISNEFICQWLRSDMFLKLVDAKIAGSSQKNLNTGWLKEFQLSLPPLDEQEEIANALSDMDSLISSLEKLIEKKKTIKQGAMQELLTGRKRLPGFSGEWKKQSFGKLCTICRGGSPRPIQNFLTNEPNGVNWIKIGDVGVNDKYINSTAEKIKESGVNMSRRVYKGDFILSNSMSFGRPYILNIDGCIHDGWLAIQDYQKAFNIDFLYYLLSSNYVFEQYIQMAAGSSVQNLNKEKVTQLSVYVPTIEEQNEIALILSDIDEEITALEQKLSKCQRLKQGMMQQLLTGKIRLI